MRARSDLIFSLVYRVIVIFLTTWLLSIFWRLPRISFAVPHRFTSTQQAAFLSWYMIYHSNMTLCIGHSSTSLTCIILTLLTLLPEKVWSCCRLPILHSILHRLILEAHIYRYSTWRPGGNNSWHLQRDITPSYLCNISHLPFHSFHHSHCQPHRLFPTSPISKPSIYLPTHPPWHLPTLPFYIPSSIF